jgi:uncharacterized integral membrane protein
MSTTYTLSSEPTDSEKSTFCTRANEMECYDTTSWKYATGIGWSCSVLCTCCLIMLIIIIVFMVKKQTTVSVGGNSSKTFLDKLVGGC